jgi:drug/metabolite transporter (DMT)-like permease
MGIIWGLTAALCWGITDFLVTIVARRIGTIHTMFYIECCALLTACSLVLASPVPPHAPPTAWAFVVGISLVNLAATILFYRALTIGTLALVAPIMSGYAVVSALLAFIAGERPDTLPLIGALLLIIGVVVVSKSENTSGRVTLTGVREAIVVALLLGLFFWALGFVTPSLGVLWPVLVMRVIRTISALLLRIHKGSPSVSLPHKMLVVIPSAAILDTLGFVAFNLGISRTYTTIVTALAALMTAITVLLAWAILRERLSYWQWIGVGVIMAGVLLVNF